jgi:glycerol-3-phosphate acyltransferase PlsY
MFSIDLIPYYSGGPMNNLFIVFGYLLGSVPFGLLYGRLAGIDVRQQGSRNIGATNVNRLLGKKLGLLTLASDLLKGLVPMLLCSHFLSGPDAPRLVMLTGLAALLGHCWPIYLKFKGGKGVATALGIFLYLAPLPTLAAILIFIGTVWLSGFVSLGSMSAALSLPLIIALTGGDYEILAVSGLIALLIIVKHHENISRLLQGAEKSWKNSGNGRKN